MSARIYSVIDLFAGAGGMTQGFKDSGRFRSVSAVEMDKGAAATYSENFGDHVENCDIADVEEFHPADIVIGGPPCQGFSNLGKKDDSDPRNQMWQEFLRAVAAIQPLAFVIENVPGFLKSAAFIELSAFLERADVARNGKPYHLRSGILNAADFDVPQNRKRAFVIGAVTPISLPAPRRRLPLFGGRGNGLMTLGDAGVFDGLSAPSEMQLPGDPPYKTSDLHLRRNPTPKSLERYKSIGKGGNRFQIPVHLRPACWLNKPTGTTDVMGRMELEKPAPTIRTEFFKPEKGRYLHPSEHRPITHLEAARIQTFPDDYKWHGSKISIARQIGNAVPPNLALALAEVIAGQLDTWTGRNGETVS